jgi:UDP-glucose 4-epimerase
VSIQNHQKRHSMTSRRAKRLCGPRFSSVDADVRDFAKMDAVFVAHEIGGVAHFAGYKVVVALVAQPLRYFDSNVASTLILPQCMERAGVRRILFSSWTIVYGDPDEVPISY